MRRSCAGRRRVADPGVPVPADRPAVGGGRDRQGRQRQEGSVPGALGHGQCRRQDHRRRQPPGTRHRARRLVRLQHLGLRHARAADPRAHHRRAGHFRCHPFSAAARWQRHFVGRRARIRSRAGTRRRRGRRRRRVYRNPSRSRLRAVGRSQHGAAARVRSSGADADRVRRACQEFRKECSALMPQTGLRPHQQRMPPVLNIIALATFAASLSARALDPVLPHIAGDFNVSIATAAGFASVFAFTFAIIQPVLGAAADLFGKARLVILCLVLLGLANILGALSSSFPLLFATRILAGIGAGGVFPIALGLTSDLVGPEKRQVAIGRTLAGAMTGNLLGASLSGLIGDFLGWRGVLAVLGSLAVVASVAGALGFGGALTPKPAKMNFSGVKDGYRTIFTNPNAKICYSAVFIEGCCVLGLFPYIASFLFEQGVTSLSISGLVIAGFAVGGLFYTFSVSRLLPRFGVNGMMASGAALMGLQLAIVAFGPPWQAQVGVFILMGWGFYMIHGSLQVFASELSVEARATALSLHSFFFFMGQTIGPIVYGFGILNVGKTPTLLASAVIIVALGLAFARWLRQRRTADAGVASSP